eukprot:4632066-Prymnesium_polylepis.2
MRSSTLIGVLAIVLVDLANTANTTPWHSISCCTCTSSTANTTGSRVLAVLAWVSARVLAGRTGISRSAQSIAPGLCAHRTAARRRTAMRQAMRPAPAAAARPDSPRHCPVARCCVEHGKWHHCTDRAPADVHREVAAR